MAPFLVKKVAREVFGQWAAVKLLERGVICQPASQRWNLLKITPPLTLAAAEAQEIVAAVAGVLADYQGVPALLNDVTRRIGKQFMAGWGF